MEGGEQINGPGKRVPPAIDVIGTLYPGSWMKHANHNGQNHRAVSPPRVGAGADCAHNPPEAARKGGLLTHALTKQTFDGGCALWLYRQNEQATGQAAQELAKESAGFRDSAAGLSGTSRPLRRGSLSWRGRSVWSFVQSYFFRLGFLDGSRGFHDCASRAMIEYWVDLKKKELQSPWAQANDKLVETLLAEPRE